jgi:hypothetical protein
MSQPVARALREALAGVVENGTARRVHGVFQNPDGTPMTMGGKTGSGDNRVNSYASGGRLIASRPVSRTAAFVFYVGDRYYGVVTASVLGSQSGNYVFTSALRSKCCGASRSGCREHGRRTESGGGGIAPRHRP